MLALWIVPDICTKVNRNIVTKLLLLRKERENVASDFWKAVKHRLIDMGQTQEWLMEEVRKKTASPEKPKGMFIDSPYLQKILRGERKSQKIVSAICEILEIEMGQGPGQTSNKRR